MLCKHHFSKNGQVFFHIFWVVTLIMQSRDYLQVELLRLMVMNRHTSAAILMKITTSGENISMNKVASFRIRLF
ncbi:hypothetical protein EAI91_12710 [Lacticaseibacillus paracasei]|nr:hypothetical protein DBQ61_13335 [Lactobacillus sp. DS22_6]RYS95680.1 hypothetical protein EAI91_12710 [Lacticaseibacillus paracasei]